VPKSAVYLTCRKRLEIAGVVLHFNQSIQRLVDVLRAVWYRFLVTKFSGQGADAAGAWKYIVVQREV
jgi:hypothetical protein